MKKVFAVIGALIISSVILLLGARFVGDKQVPMTPSIIDTAVLESLTTKDASGINTSHVETGLAPPTNKWFSGVALQAEPRAVFPSPLSFLPKDSSFEVGLPKIKTTEKSIYGPHVPDMAVTISGASSYKVTRYDELSVDLTYSSASAAIGTTTITAGSPFVFFTASQDTKVIIPTMGRAVTTKNNRITLAGIESTSAIAGSGDTSFATDKDQIIATIPSGSFISLYAIPNNKPDVLSAVAGNRITGTSVSYAATDDTYQTVLHLKTANNENTALGYLPHQRTKDTLSSLSYDSLYGESKIGIHTAFTFTTDKIETVPSLKLDTLSSEQKALLITTLRRDINATMFNLEDTYFGGKSLYRAAQLLELAHQLQEKEIASSIQQKLRREFDTWLSQSPRSTKSFYYDSKIKGIVGQTVAFGSEAFNDHHFHYGYFIYAASILAKYDTDFVEKHKSMMNLIVADIANYKSNEEIPLRRSFDPYFGHSWASGSSPFNDGNNQESSSEAINAWVGIDLWAQQINNSELSQQAKWMLSNEVASTSSYWLNIDKTKGPYANGYSPSIVSLNWGGKRDYATFFSADPNAILGILLIPMSPTTVYQKSYGDKIAQQVQEALPSMNTSAQFADYILMYSALSSNSNLLDMAKTVPDTTIDGANSRSYMYAWLMSR